MAGPTLGTLLIQRLDAALGTTLSQQTQIVNRTSSDPVTHPSQITRPEPVSNTLVRDTRENVDRALLNTRPNTQVNVQQHTHDLTGAHRVTSQNFTSSASTSLGLAARIILNLFANHTTATPPITSRTPLLKQGPHTFVTPSAETPLTKAPSTPPATTPSATTSARPAVASPTASSTSAPAERSDVPSVTTRIPLNMENTASLAQNLARALAHSLQRSGLFYESHLKSMARGQYRISDLRHEPQAQISSTLSERNSASNNRSTSHSIVQPATSQSTVSQAAASQTTQSNLPTPGIDIATHSIVRQQLEALADQSIHWRGEAWPGASMHWQIKRQPDHEHTPDIATGPNSSWQSRIKIQLPRLGDITIVVRLEGKDVHVALQAAAVTTPLLQQHRGQLVSQMSDRQLELTSLTFLAPEKRQEQKADINSDPSSDPSSAMEPQS